MTEFKDHFSGHARQYASARPDYPAELFKFLAGLTPRRELACDLATGNGQAATALADWFHNVYASDASDDQIKQATPHPRVKYHCRPAESCDLGDNTVDLVTVAQAAHWLDLEKFYPEVRRVLRKSGILALWCYGISTVNEQVDACFHHLYESILGPYWPPERHLVENGYAQLEFPFDAMATPNFELSMQWSCDQYLAYLRSWSASQRYQQDQGKDPVSQIETDLRQSWPTRPTTVHWPISMKVARMN
jgi:SAM-dependent methyltransferase